VVLKRLQINQNGSLVSPCSLSLSFSRVLSLSLALSLAHARNFSCAQTPLLSLSQSLAGSLSPSFHLSLPLSLSPALSFSLSSLTRALSPCVCPSLNKLQTHRNFAHMRSAAAAVPRWASRARRQQLVLAVLAAACVLGAADAPHGRSERARAGGGNVLRLRGGRASARRAPPPTTAGNAWDTLAEDEDLGGKPRLTHAQRQSRLKRERQRGKERDAIDLDDDPRINERIAGSLTLSQHLGHDVSSSEIPDPDAPIDLASLPHLPWERPFPAEAEAPGTHTHPHNTNPHTHQYPHTHKHSRTHARKHTHTQARSAPTGPNHAGSGRALKAYVCVCVCVCVRACVCVCV